MSDVNLLTTFYSDDQIYYHNKLYAYNADIVMTLSVVRNTLKNNIKTIKNRNMYFNIEQIEGTVLDYTELEPSRDFIFSSNDCIVDTVHKFIEMLENPINFINIVNIFSITQRVSGGTITTRIHYNFYQIDAK